MMNNKRALVAAIFLAWMPLVIGVAYPAVWQWSETASSNASADPTINWRSGMAPSAVSPSARAMMAAVAGYRDDISGALTTTGTASAYLVTTNQGLPNPPTDGQLLAITVNITNGIAPTLSADGGGTFPIQSAAGVAVPAGTLISGSPYSLKFSLTNNAWLLRDFYPSPLITPLGGLVPYTGATSPNSNFILPAGQCISTTTYASYWALMGSPASGSCAGGQFQVVDLRGRTLVGLDNLNGTAANRLTTNAAGCGTAMTSVGLSCANGTEFRQLTANLIPTIASNANNSITVAPQSGGTSISVFNGAPSILSNVEVTNSGSGPFWVSSINSSLWAAVTALGNSSQPIAVVSNNTGGSGPFHPTVDPNLAVTFLLRVI